MNIVKNKPENFKVGSFYSILLGVEAQIMCTFLEFNKNTFTLYFKNLLGEEKAVVIAPEILREGIYVVEHEPFESKWVITVGNEFIIHSFNSKEEADLFLNENKELVYQLDGAIQAGDNCVEVMPGSKLIQISEEVFLENELAGGCGSYNPEWIKKTEDLREYLDRV